MVTRKVNYWRGDDGFCVLVTASLPEQRGTPAFRPIERHLDHSRRPWANTIPETIFTVHMIRLGVQNIGLANTTFRNTVGKIESVKRFFPY
jgi:hypothetical protein